MQLESNHLPILLTGFYLSKEAEGCSPKTLKDYRYSLAHWVRWAGNQSPNGFTPSDLKAFLAGLHHTNLSPKSIYNIWVGMRSFYRWYCAEFNQPNPMSAIPAPKTEDPVIVPLTQEQVHATLRACDQSKEASTSKRTPFHMRRQSAGRDRAIVLTLLDTGLRASELCALVVSDLDLSSGQVVVRRGKGGKGRIVYVGKATRRVLWRYLAKRKVQAEEPLFATREGRMISTDYLDKLFRRLGERAGVVGFHPHRLRHTFATQFLRNGGNLLGLQRLLGHSSLEMVRRYAEVAEADLARMHSAGSPVDSWRL